MKRVKETDRIVEERTVLCINQGQEGDEAGRNEKLWTREKRVKMADDVWKDLRVDWVPSPDFSQPQPQSGF